MLSADSRLPAVLCCRYDLEKVIWNAVRQDLSFVDSMTVTHQTSHSERELEIQNALIHSAPFQDQSRNSHLHRTETGMKEHVISPLQSQNAGKRNTSFGCHCTVFPSFHYRCSPQHLLFVERRQKERCSTEFAEQHRRA